MKLLALAASHRPDSLNRRLLALAITQAETAGATVTTLDYAMCEAPLYRGDSAALPKGAAYLSEQLRAHDGILLASPEYNWSIPGELKNLIDWLSTERTSPFQDRTALLLCASPSLRGGISGLQHLRTALETLGMMVYPQLIGIGGLTPEDTLTLSDKDARYLNASVTGFVRLTRALIAER